MPWSSLGFLVPLSSSQSCRSTSSGEMKGLFALTSALHLRFLSLPHWHSLCGHCILISYRLVRLICLRFGPVVLGLGFLSVFLLHRSSMDNSMHPHALMFAFSFHSCSEFSDIFDLDHFKRVLADDVHIVSSLPSTHIMTRPVEEKRTPLHVSPSWIRSRYLKRVRIYTLDFSIISQTSSCYMTSFCMRDKIYERRIPGRYEWALLQPTFSCKRF